MDLNTITLDILRKEAEQMWKSDLLSKGISYHQATQQSSGRFNGYSKADLERYIGVRAYINLPQIQN